ncbi:hypothetical protein EV126DRAFT_126872 [Verticillium dahliae]|nr:hypothetical protein EV126DRAFT_126872 [Verticillium dahliae]
MFFAQRGFWYRVLSIFCVHDVSVAILYVCQSSPRWVDVAIAPALIHSFCSPVSCVKQNASPAQAMYYCSSGLLSSADHIVKRKLRQAVTSEGSRVVKSG